MPGYGLGETHYEKGRKLTVAQAIAEGFVTLEKVTTETLGPDGTHSMVVKHRAVFKHNGLELDPQAYEQGIAILRDRIAKLPPPKRRLAIKTKAETDDAEVRVVFDALEWFKQASDREIQKLAACGWGGDYEADHVAEHFHETTTYSLFAHLEEANKNRDPHGPDPVGYECHIDERAALRWLKKNRPHLHAVLRNRK